VKQFLRHLEVRYPHYHKWVETWRKRIRHWFIKD
jgi:hypothetical protein